MTITEALQLMREGDFVQVFQANGMKYYQGFVTHIEPGKGFELVEEMRHASRSGAEFYQGSKFAIYPSLDEPVLYTFAIFSRVINFKL